MNKTRLQFDLTDEALEQFEALKEASGATTGAELFRKALVLYSWFHEQRDNGYSLVLRKGSKEKQVELLI